MAVDGLHSALGTARPREHWGAPGGHDARGDGSQEPVIHAKFLREFFHNFKDQRIPWLLKPLKEEKLPNSLYEISKTRIPKPDKGRAMKKNYHFHF